MTKIIRAEIYKLFHSIYYWGIAGGYFLIVSLLVPDHSAKTSVLRSSMYPISFMIFMIFAFAIAMIGNVFDQRLIQTYIASGHKRSEVVSAKLIVFLGGSVGMMLGTLLIHGLVGMIFMGESIDFKTILILIPSFFAVCLVPACLAFVFKDIGKTLGSGLAYYVLMMFSLNTDGISDKAVYLPYGHSILAYFDLMPEDITGLLLIDAAWIAFFLTVSYIALSKSDLK